MSVGMPEELKLQEFGSLIYGVFEEVAYHVGSSLANKRDWRDVDVRLILPDDKWVAKGFLQPGQEWHCEKWVGLVRAFSALGREMTGLPIDFQIQQQSDANKKFSNKDGHRRSALLVVPLRLCKDDKERFLSKPQTTEKKDGEPN